MFFLTRIRYSGFKSITNQCKRHYSSVHGVVKQYHHISGFTKSGVFDRNEHHGFVRFFAAPVMANKPKSEQNAGQGLRLNDKITADFVRLVSDDGHAVVSRREALDRAKKLKLDLVEVDRSAKPPVCKIMDHHKEKYKSQVKEKERAKSKVEGTLRKGPGKEIRFTKKTEKKDLQTKADTVKRLMEKGYRVKCMVVGTEDEDLGEMLSRLTALIEDVAVVESGPMVEKKQAYVLVRHMKFGLKKGSSKKASMASTSPQATTPNSEPVEVPLEVEEESDDAVSHSESEDDTDPDQTETPSGDPEEHGMAWSTLDANDDFEKIFGFDENNSAVSSSIGGGETDGVFPLEDVVNATLPTQGPTQVGENRYSRVHSSQVNRGPGATNTVPRGPAQVGENRYGGQSEVRSRFQRTAPTERLADNTKLPELSSAHTSQVNRGPGPTTRVVENRYGGQSEVRSRFQPTVPTERLAGNTKIPEFSPAHTNHVNRGPAPTITVPRGPTQVVENRYGGRNEVGNRFQSPNSTERTADNTKLSEFSRVHPGGPTQVVENRYAVNRVPGAPRTFNRGPESPYQGRQPQREMSNPVPSEHKRPSYGIFSASKHPTPSRQSVNVDAKPIAEDSQMPESKTSK